MRNVLVITGLSVAIAIGGATFVLAGNHGGMDHGFAEVDTNGDGKITQDEMQAHRAARFSMADTDGNGTLSSDEMMTRAQERMTRRISHMIKRFDGNGDGELSLDEMGQRHKGGMFTQMDSDGDGAISAEEFDAMKAMRGNHGMQASGMQASGMQAGGMHSGGAMND